MCYALDTKQGLGIVDFFLSCRSATILLVIEIFLLPNLKMKSAPFKKYPEHASVIYLSIYLWITEPASCPYFLDSSSSHEISDKVPFSLVLKGNLNSKYIYIKFKDQL